MNLARLLADARAEEREACAQVAEAVYAGAACDGSVGPDGLCDHQRAGVQIAAAIRTREAVVFTGGGVEVLDTQPVRR